MVPEFISITTDRQAYHVITWQSSSINNSSCHARGFWKLQVSELAAIKAPQISQTEYFPILILNSCVADNSLGRSKKYMELSGRPGPAEFHSAPWSKSPDSYNLTWKVDSYPPLQEVRLLYRKLMVMMMITEKIEKKSFLWKIAFFLPYRWMKHFNNQHVGMMVSRLDVYLLFTYLICVWVDMCQDSNG